VKVEFRAYVEQVTGNRAGHLSEKLRVSASYEIPGLLGSLTFDVPVDQAQEYYIGQELTISISKSVKGGV